MEMKRLNSISICIMLLFIMGLIGGCGSADKAAAPQTKGVTLSVEDKEVKGEITVWGWNVAAKSLKLTAEKFQAKYPDTKITVVDIGRTELYDKLTVGLASGEGLPDIIQVDERFQVFATKFPDGFVDMTPKASKYKKDFDPSKWPIVTRDGKIYALPWDSGPAALFYRTDLFAQADIDVNTIKTWDDLIGAGKKISDMTQGKTKLLPVDISNDDGILRVLFNQNKTFYFNDRGDITINSPLAIESLTLLQKMYKANLVVDTPSWDAIVTACKNGAVAAIPYGVWYSGTLEDQAPELKGKWGVMPLPAYKAGGNQAAHLGGSQLAISASSRNAELAWKFIEYSLATSEGQIAMLDKYGLFPSYMPSYSDKFFDQEVAYFGGQKIWKTFASITKDIPPANYANDFFEAEHLVVNAQSKALRDNADPNAVLQKAAEEIASATGRKIAQ